MSRLGKLMAGWGAGNSRITRPRRNTLFSRAAARLSANEVKNLLEYGHVLTENQRLDLEHRAGNLRSLDTYMTRVYYPRQERMRRIKTQKKRWLVYKYGDRWLKRIRSSKSKK